MRTYHINYFKALVEQIQIEVGGVTTSPFVGKFFEVAPPLTSFKDTAPFCAIHHCKIENQLDSNYRANKISSIVKDGKKVLRVLQKHFLQEYTYQLDFWCPIPVQDADFEPSKVLLLDQALSYISKNPISLNQIDTVNNVDVEIRVKVGCSGIEYDPESFLDLYKTFIKVTMRDGLFEVIEDEALSISEIKPVYEHQKQAVDDTEETPVP